MCNLRNMSLSLKSGDTYLNSKPWHMSYCLLFSTDTMYCIASREHNSGISETDVVDV